MASTKRYIIESVTNEGKAFRPSDWIDRVCSLGASYFSQRLNCSPHLYPKIINGKRCLVLCEDMKDSNKILYDHVLKFAHSNNLKMDEVHNIEELS